MRVGLVHEWLTVPGGSELVLEAVAGLYPAAPIHTLIYRPRAFAGRPLAEHPIRTSMLQRLPGARRRYRWLLPLMPMAVERFDLGDFDVVISSHHAVAKGVLTREDQLHVSYVHTPPRYAWDLRGHYGRGGRRGLRGLAVDAVLHYLRLWDAATVPRVDLFVANSRCVARRIRKTYRRPARVVHPPVNVERFRPDRRREDFFLTVSRFVPYKRVDVIIEAFNRLKLPLVVIGDGPEHRRLARRAGATVRMTGRLPDDAVADHLERCRAFVFAAEEDFGIVPVEAQAAGAPVIAYGRGGARETVVAGETGLFFDAQEPAALAEAVCCFQRRGGGWDPRRIREQAERFAPGTFRRRFASLVEAAWQRFRRGEDVEAADG